jgi:hypothetical protein
VGTVCLQHSLCKTSLYPQHKGLKCEKPFLGEVTQKNWNPNCDKHIGMYP